MATLKSIPKAKVWYKHIKEGDKILVQLHPKHIWYSQLGDKLIEVRVAIKHPDGTFFGYFGPLIAGASSPCIALGWEGTDWEKDFSAKILRKVKE